ncbi:hypothetical protein [Shimia sp.]|uniref:hypothetical protein n=1 Tax=Shimia sp. TaxID=1954381 RepID=UPI0032992DDF
MFDPELLKGSADVRRIARPGQVRSVFLSDDPHTAPTCLMLLTNFFKLSDQTPIELGHDDAVLDLVICPVDQSVDIKLCIAER